jgi:hypothetical protein
MAANFRPARPAITWRECGVCPNNRAGRTKLMFVALFLLPRCLFFATESISRAHGREMTSQRLWHEGVYRQLLVGFEGGAVGLLTGGGDLLRG